MSSAALDRQVRPIYDALDTGSNKSAVTACNKFLKKNPKNTLVKALKTLALVRLQKFEEAILLCDEVLAAKCTDDATLSAMMHVLRGLGRHSDMVVMFENAFKQHPTNEDLGAQTFFANVRTGHWREAQLVATKLHKNIQEDRFLYWSIMCAILQANDPATLLAMRQLLYKLAHRLVGTSATPSHKIPERFHLHLYILRELRLFDEARTLLDSEVGIRICSQSLACDEMRRDLWRLAGLWQKESEHAEQRIVKEKDRNWLEFLSIIDATFAFIGSDGEERATCLERVQKSRQLFMRVAEEDGTEDRAGSLALLELEMRSKSHGLSAGPAVLVDSLECYFKTFGEKACCFEDVRPYLRSISDDLTRWTDFLNSFPRALSTFPGIQRTINIHKLLRYSLPHDQLTVELEISRASQLVGEYLEALNIGKNLPATELQPADDLALLAGQVFVNLWKLTGKEGHLFSAAALLEFALTKSGHSFQTRLMLVRIYHLLGAPSLALNHYRRMNVKQVQNDTLSHFMLTRASTFSLATIGDLTYPSECLESSQIYMSNSQETSEFIIRAFTSEKYSQIPHFISFEDRLENSLQRDIIKIEHVRMRITHEQITSDLIDTELIELKFIFDRVHYDNRDYRILPNYQPYILPSFDMQTALFDEHPGVGWLSLFLKVYIRALQQASDLNDAVEEKLLVGDRPKASHNLEHNVQLKERLRIRKQEELDELTELERAFIAYATSLADWLEPYHDHVRPSPSTVLAEAAKQGELKPGHPLKKADGPANGHAQATATDVKEKEKEPLFAVEPPEEISQFFESMSSHLREGSQAKKSIPELLHITTLTQEALVLLSIESRRFKPAAITKVHKLGHIVQNIKSIRTHAIAVLKDMSNLLLTIAKMQDQVESRAAFVKAAKAVTDSGVGHDFVLSIAKNVTEARKKVLDGVGKGIVKVTTLHA